MKTTLTLVAGTFVGLGVAVNGATAYTGADKLIKDCTVTATKPEDAFRQTHCTGYVAGILDAHGTISGAYKNIKIFCASQEGLTIDVAVSHWFNGCVRIRNAIFLPAARFC